jgi:hypothetical protein
MQTGREITSLPDFVYFGENTQCFMNNYDKMLADALQRFTTYDRAALARRPGVEGGEEVLSTCFLGEHVLLNPERGAITVGGRPAGFGEALSILDWLCDGRLDAQASGTYCTVSSLPGVLVSGSGLTMNGSALAAKIHETPEKFCDACRLMGGKAVSMGDIGYCLPIFPGVCVCLKFYFGDEEFAPQLTFLWDQNILQFVRYETVYYIAGCLLQRLRRLM